MLIFGLHRHLQRCETMYTCDYIHTCIYMTPPRHTHTCIHIHAHIHTRIHTHMHTYIHACNCTCICTHMHIYSRSCTHTHMHSHTCIHTLAHTCTHTRLWVFPDLLYHAQSTIVAWATSPSKNLLRFTQGSGDALLCVCLVFERDAAFFKACISVNLCG